MVRPVSHLRFISLIKYYKAGTHLDNPKFAKILWYRRGQRIDVEAPEGFIYTLDGELITKSRFTVEVAPKAIRFAVPKGAASIAGAQKQEARETVTV